MDSINPAYHKRMENRPRSDKNQSLLDIMNIREGSSVLKFSDDSTFSAYELSFIMLHVATNRMD